MGNYYEACRELQLNGVIILDQAINYYGLVEKMGQNILEKGFEPKIKGLVKRLFQIIRMEAFKPYESWEVYFHEVDDKNVEYIAVMILWDRESDLSALDTPAEQLKLRDNKSTLPTIERKQVVLNTEEIIGILSILENMRLCPIPKASRYTLSDGTNYSMKIEDWTYSCCFKWTNSGPDNWIELRQVADKAIQVISSSIEAQGIEV